VFSVQLHVDDTGMTEKDKRMRVEWLSILSVVDDILRNL